MHLNVFADTVEPLDMAATDEFQSLLESARDLGIPHSPGVRYRSRNIVLRHHRMHFLEWGDPAAPPVLLLHGGHQSAHSWDLVSLHLSDRYHVIAIDQRGHGDSEWRPDGDYAPRTMAEDAVAAVQALGLDRPIIMGHSMGGIVTMNLMKYYPDLARAVVVVDVGPEIAPAGAAAIGKFIQSVVEFDDLDEFVERVHQYDPFRSREHIERTVRYNMLRRTDGKYVSKCDRNRWGATQARNITEGVTLDDLRAFQAPALVIRGEQSNVLEPDAAERFAAALPQGALALVDKCGHNVHTQNTPGFLEVITPFLANLKG